MNRTKVTVACKACQKKKVKCTGISPCTNCIRAGHRCEFTGTAKKRGPRNGNVEIIKSTARRLENVLQKHPDLRGKIEHLLAGNSRPTIRSARPPPVIPPNAPIVIIDDDSGITVDASQSHGIPRPTPLSYDHYERHGHVAMNLNKYRNTTIDTLSPVLHRPIPMYPQNMPRNSHVTIEQHQHHQHQQQQHQHQQQQQHHHHDVDPLSSSPLPSISELDASLQKDDVNPKSNRMMLPTPINNSNRKKTMSMIVNGIEVLLPAAPDIENPLDSSKMLLMDKNQHHIKLAPLDLHDSNDTKPPISPFLSLPSPPSSQSPKSVSPGPYNTTFGNSQSYPFNSPPSSPERSCNNVLELCN